MCLNTHFIHIAGCLFHSLLYLSVNFIWCGNFWYKEWDDYQKSFDFPCNMSMSCLKILYCITKWIVHVLERKKNIFYCIHFKEICSFVWILSLPWMSGQNEQWDWCWCLLSFWSEESRDFCPLLGKSRTCCR